MENWEKITRRADAGIVECGGWLRMRVLSGARRGVRAGFGSKENRLKGEENLWSAPSLIPRLWLPRKREEKIQKRHYQLLFFLTRNEAPSVGVTFDIFQPGSGRGERIVLARSNDEWKERETRKIKCASRSQINNLCLLLLSVRRWH